MTKSFKYTSLQEQIEKLKDQKLIFEDEHQAKDILSIYGRYNVINSYREPYLMIEGGKRVYKNGITFERIFSLFTFDHYLKMSIMTAMLDVEEMLRSALAEVISQSYGVDHNVYLDESNYENLPKTDKYYSLESLLSKIRRKIAEIDTLPLTHYRDTHNLIPPWILFRELPFFTLVNFVRQLKAEEKKKIVMILYGVDEETAKKEGMHFLLEDTLLICREYRNLAAHSARIYNHQLEHSCRIPDKDDLDYLRIIYPFIDALKRNQNKGISLLINLLNLFAYEQPYHFVNDQVCSQVTRHCQMYPEDASILEPILGGTITIMLQE